MEKFEEQAALHKLDSLINFKFDNTEDHRQSLKAGSNELILFEEQALFLFAVFWHILKKVKGKELVQRNKKDPILVWKELLHHHKGSDASMDAAMKLLQHLFQLNSSKFNSWLQFLAEYDTIIEYYNRTNTAVMSDEMKQQFLRLGVVQNSIYATHLISQPNARLLQEH